MKQLKRTPVIDDVTQQFWEMAVISKIPTGFVFFNSFSNYGITCEFIRSLRCVNYTLSSKV